jgi:Leucine-rich repeat (LRR) protein
LYLNDNELTSVPAELGGLGALEKLYLERNQLTSVPAKLGGLGALKKLYLSDNQLTSVPAELGGLGALKESRGSLAFFPPFTCHRKALCTLIPGRHTSCSRN